MAFSSSGCSVSTGIAALRGKVPMSQSTLKRLSRRNCSSARYFFVTSTSFLSGTRVSSSESIMRKRSAMFSIAASAFSGALRVRQAVQPRAREAERARARERDPLDEERDEQKIPAQVRGEQVARHEQRD